MTTVATTAELVDGPGQSGSGDDRAVTTPPSDLAIVRAEDRPAREWRHLVVAEDGVPADDTVRPRRVYAQVLVLGIVVVLAVAILSALAARRIAERQAVYDIARDAVQVAGLVIEPALRDGLVTGEPAAVSRLDQAVRDHLLGEDVVRVKIWRADGTILYSDETRLQGQRFELEGEELGVLRRPGTRAEVSDLAGPENVYERGQGRLLEVYRPVVTPGGEVLLFEMYAPYDIVRERSRAIWRVFGGLTLSTLMVLVVLLLPILWRLLDRLRSARVQRERLLQRALQASDDERRRIAAGLHDGVVQELAATSFMVSGAAARATAAGRSDLAQTMEEAAGAVRTGINGLRSLLVDIYPPSLESTGLQQALTDLVDGFATHEVDVVLHLDTDGEPPLDRNARRLLFQVAQETTRNAVRHSGATTVDVTLETVSNRGGEDGVRLLVADDGVGFDVDEVLASPEHGHFGMRLLLDAARENDADLWVTSAPGSGTTWCVETRR